ncbi:uncharacterized protein F4807DRAFT_471394 [Annulohypoxylon truncatum]|uniref:uncharacterized protein n=1 Tax=Annulohypoxylon truncatum TaxID=327061 RepID=UPI002008C78A|nr:uncharacterized protein F4807DRAFT_471394 [Annulohypoxylon truncatum]KAI1204938.1 hypothetical protein F4807DRAFT_471394 [Annulohypoxylon truncatum]
MAFTAVHYPTDKDQGHIPYWPDNEELGVASENFFDQFVTFDGSDPTAAALSVGLEDPPSPSILLDSLNDNLTNSSASDQGTQSGQAQSESSATSASLGTPLACPEETPLEHCKSVPAELTNPLLADPILSGGSISDSELLRLEGISLKSPKPSVTTPSSPPFATSSPSPRKHNRVLDSIYATFRRATHRSKPRKQAEANAEIMMADAFKGGEHASYDLPANLDLSDFGDIKLEDIPVPVDSHGIPVSPPLTGRIPPDQNSNDILNFVNGHFDDPFCDGLLAPPATIHPAGKSHDGLLDTPIDTPSLNDDPFYHGMGILDTNGSSFRPQPKLRSTSSAEWPMEGILTNDTNANAIWSSSGSPSGPSYDAGNPMASPGWWDTPNGHHSHHPHHHHHHRGNTAPLNLSMHGAPPDLPYEYGANPDLSGLMIHMPQPRAPQAAVLSSGAMNDAYYNGSATTPRHHRRHYSEQRRPRPRAPSSGARHYTSTNGGGSGVPRTPLTSPRKISSGSSSTTTTACYTLREEPPSPTPNQRHRSASGSSLAVRKRRSWRGRQNLNSNSSEPRTPGGGARSVSSSCRPGGFEGSLSHSHGPARRVSMSNMRGDGEGGGGGRRGGGGGGGGGGALSIEFCNYTPSDKKVLMNGVAPSGSSKTKARREREAQEHKRKMSEAYMQAIRAAGGDVEKLRQNGFFGGGEYGGAH